MFLTCNDLHSGVTNGTRAARAARTMRSMNGNTRRMSSKELWLILLFWGSFATLGAFNRLLDPRGGLAPLGPLVFPYVEAGIWAALTPLIFILASRSTLDRNWVFWIPLLIAVGIGVAIAVDSLLDITRLALFPRGRRMGMRLGMAPMRSLARFRFLHQFLVYLAILAAGFAREYFVRDQTRQREAAELHAQLAQARLDALRMQLNPHFLFNTLNAISALVERDPAGVRRMIARLSDLLRYTLETRGDQEVPLRQELANVDRYADIMKVRFQGRLEVSTAIDPDVLDARVPTLILQPLVENAFEHGVGKATGTGRMEIAASRDGGSLVLTVRDNGPGITGTGDGVGLSNTRARLAQRYGEAAAVVLRSHENGGTVAEIRLPYHDA